MARCPCPPCEAAKPGRGPHFIGIDHGDPAGDQQGYALCEIGPDGKTKVLAVSDKPFDISFRWQPVLDRRSRADRDRNEHE